MSHVMAQAEVLFFLVLRISWQASILVLLVLAAQYLFRKQLPQRWRYVLWLLVLVRLLLPVLPASPFSIYRIMPPSLNWTAVRDFPKDSQDAVSSSATTGPSASAPLVGKNPAFWIGEGFHLATILWLAGVGLMTCAALAANGRFTWALRSAPPCRDDDLLATAKSCANELGLQRSIEIVETSLVSSPAVFGLFRARLLLPIGLTRSLDAGELRLVLLHELAHLRRGDIYHNALLSLLQIVHWFNPLLWFAFARIRHDREMATDALVLSGPRTSLKTLYGQTLIKLIERSDDGAFSPQLVGIMNDPDRLKDRLVRIRQATPEAYGWSTWGLALLALIGAMSLTSAYGAVDTLIYRAQTSTNSWNGWGLYSPPDPQQDQAIAPAPEQFTLVANPGVGPRVFSGKVIAPGSMKGVEVGLVSLVGVHWVNPDAYQWVPVAADGSFSLTDARYQDAPKAIAVRGPDLPWTFLRYNFGPGESAHDIVLRPSPAKKVRLTASGTGRKNLSQMSYEIFPAHIEYNDQGQALRRQRLGEFSSGDKGSLTLDAPAGEIALFIHHDGFAGFYQIIDTRQASNFHFIMKHAGRMKITTLDAAGKPKGGVHLKWVNPAAPLSISGSATNANGILLQDNLTPGTFDLDVEGFAPRQIVVEEGKLVELQLQDGVDP
jgi:beta-lactamase regulating signal transducer with metallopeptidase domain